MLLLQRIYLYGRSRTAGRRHLPFQPLSLLRRALSTLLSGCRKLGRPLVKNTVRWNSAVQRLASGWAKTHAPGHPNPLVTSRTTNFIPWSSSCCLKHCRTSNSDLCDTAIMKVCNARNKCTRFRQWSKHAYNVDKTLVNPAVTVAFVHYWKDN